MILVTGAGGKTGRAVVRALSARGEPVTALVRRSLQDSDALAAEGVKLAVADLLDPDGMKLAMNGMRTVYLIAPNVHPAEERIGEIAIAAAVETGVERIVYHSVLHPQTREMPHHWQKLGVEEKLFESGLELTILQPAAYMQNILPYWEAIVSQGYYRIPYGEGASLSLVDLEDVAEVAARVLTEPDHGDAIYELAGPDALSPAQIAAVLSGVLERPVETGRVPIPEWKEQARADGARDYAIDALARMFDYYDRFGLRGNPNVLAHLLGRTPTSFEEFAQHVPSAR